MEINSKNDVKSVTDFISNDKSGIDLKLRQDILRLLDSNTSSQDIDKFRDKLLDFNRQVISKLEVDSKKMFREFFKSSINNDENNLLENKIEFNQIMSEMYDCFMIYKCNSTLVLSEVFTDFCLYWLCIKEKNHKKFKRELQRKYKK